MDGNIYNKLNNDVKIKMNEYRYNRKIKNKFTTRHTRA